MRKLTLGWKEQHRPFKTPCPRCGRRVRHGVVNPARPFGLMLCFRCFSTIMDGDYRGDPDDAHYPGNELDPQDTPVPTLPDPPWPRI